MKNLHAILKKRKLEVFLSSIDMKDITNWKKVLDNGEIETHSYMQGIYFMIRWV